MQRNHSDSLLLFSPPSLLTLGTTNSNGLPSMYDGVLIGTPIPAKN